MKIGLIEPLGVEESLIEELAAPLKEKGHEFLFFPQKTTVPAELAARSSGCEIVMLANTPYPASAMEGNPSLKMLSVAFTGTDHIDLSYCREHQITICNSANYSNQTVAELVIGLVLSLYRKLPACNEAARNSGTGSPFTGLEIAGKTVGIIGTGRIGLQTARLFQAFGAHVIAYSRSISPAAQAMGIAYYSLDEVLRQSDIVSLHVPNTPETYHLLDGQKLSLMQPHAIFINCARGPIVDNAALAHLLQEGKLAGAGIDVFDMEPPLPSDYPLLKAPNTILTPHIAFASKESMIRRAHIVFENVYRYLDGEPQNVCPLS